MSKISISQYLPLGVVEDDVDKIGRAVMNEHARGRRLRVTGDVERVYDVFVVGVRVPDADGNMALTHVPVDSPQAEGRTSDARKVTWQADAEAITPDPAPRILGEPGAQGVVHALLPREVVEQGGMITFLHGLKSSDVLITARAADGSKAGYELAVEITTGEHQIQLPPGVSHLQAEIDTEDGER